MKSATVAVACEAMAAYQQHGFDGLEMDTVAAALKILGRRFDGSRRHTLHSPHEVRSYLALRLTGIPVEVFGTVWLDTQHHVLSTEDMFRGTLTQTSVYPREVAKRALDIGASAVILFHNHPSGSIEPSRADEFLTRTLKSALDLIDVRTIDHIIVGGGETSSMAERGLI